MSMHALALPATSPGPTLRLLSGERRTTTSWWERRASMRAIVGGCPDHWWKPTARTTSACTCDRF